MMECLSMLTMNDLRILIAHTELELARYLEADKRFMAEREVEVLSVLKDELAYRINCTLNAVRDELAKYERENDK